MEYQALPQEFPLISAKVLVLEFPQDVILVV
jgi:hypothetical protein